ncbi:MAG TPA: hypothetical protein VEV16_05375, partial [Daejeonella sp.]|nr:hypothetical protein [Daejeonella sp.]
MKRVLFSVFISLCFTVMVKAQAPQQFNYQGAARTSSGAPLMNRNISLKISILDGSVNGAIQYSEIHKVTTNALGLYSLAIGGPNAQSKMGNMADVNWAKGLKYIQVEIDPDNGSRFTVVGSAQLLSVPYALYAGNAQAGAKGDKGDKGDKGEKGDAFKYSDFTLEQLNALTGLKGNKGDKGDKGNAFKYADFTTAQLAALRGANGNSMLSGTGVPAAATGINGDTYLDISTGLVYCKSGGSWAATGASLKGVAGANGRSVLSGSGMPAAAFGQN